MQLLKALWYLAAQPSRPQWHYPDIRMSAFISPVQHTLTDSKSTKTVYTVVVHLPLDLLISGWVSNSIVGWWPPACPFKVLTWSFSFPQKKKRRVGITSPVCLYGFTTELSSLLFLPISPWEQYMCSTPFSSSSSSYQTCWSKDGGGLTFGWRLH